ncbi:MAG: beta-propeller fold lactonase family protein [Anaerolineae bacterium]|nr:beta-propeller fold lactonase family protein [Anaerolineae bacterium]
MAKRSVTARLCLVLGIWLVACGLQTWPTKPGALSAAGPAIGQRVHDPNPSQVSWFDEPRPGARGAAGNVRAVQGGKDPVARGEDPFDIVISPDGRQAYVANRSTDNLLVLDLTTGQIEEVIDLYPQAAHPLGPAPVRLALTPAGDRLLVINAHDGSVIVLDTATHTVLDTVAVGRSPEDVAISPDGSLAYVPNKHDWTVSAIDLTALEVVDTIPVPGGGGPFAVAFAPDGSRGYVAVQDDAVHVIDPATHAISRTIPVSQCGHTGDLVISPDGRRGYLAALNADRVVVLDLVGETVSDTLPVGRPKGLALNADGSRLYVGTFGWEGQSDHHLWMFDTATGQPVAGVDLVHPGAPRLVGSDILGLALAPDGGALYVASIDGESVAVVDPQTLAQVEIILTNPLPQFAPLRGVLSPDGAFLYLASWRRQQTTVSVIDTAAARVVGQVVAGPGSPCSSPSWGLDRSPDGRTLYVLGSDNRCVLVIDTASRQIVDSFQMPTGIGPADGGAMFLSHIAVHPDGDRAYVLDYNGDVYVTKLPEGYVTGAIDTTEACTVIKLSPDGQRGYVICSADFSVLDLTTDTLVETIHIGGGMSFEWLYYLGIRPDSAEYVVGAFFDFYVYQAASNTQVGHVNLETLDPTWLTLGQDFLYSPDGSLGYLAMPDENAVTVFDTSTWQVAAKIDTGRAPFFGTEPVWLLMGPDGSVLYVVNELSDNVLAIDTALNEVRAVISLREWQVNLPLVMRQPF